MAVYEHGIAQEGTVRKPVDIATKARRAQARRTWRAETRLKGAKVGVNSRRTAKIGDLR